MQRDRQGRGRPFAPMAMGILLLLMGLALAGGGVWLIALGGSWYYAVAGAALLLAAFLLFRRNPAAHWVYALLLLGTLAWSLWEVGFDWWPLAARGAVFVVVGLLLLLPWVTRPLGGRSGATSLPLAAALAVAVVVAAVSWFTDPHRIEGTAPGPRAEAPANLPAPAPDIPPGEWHAYGRTGYGQRYSPLDQITPANVSQLQEAWTYHTGDLRGRPGDPEETTFQVTPLKIGNRLFICTPHQLVIALDATTGGEIWRYDPEIRGDLALQHLTCRGLSYHPASEETAAAPAPASPAPAEPEDSPVPDMPVAANTAPETADNCPARLFMPTADGRLIALNPEDGAICTAFGGGTGQIDLWRNMPNVKPGSYYSTSPVVVTRDLIIVGGTVLDNVSVNEASGVIRAFDVNTGDLVWAWDSGDPDDTAPPPPGETYTPSSPNSWSISAVDEGLGLVYIPMGNQPPDQWGGNRSPAVERFSSSVVALDLATGQVRWNFQTVHHDLWDYDVPSQPSLIDLTVNGQTVPALVQPTKQGELFVLDRRTGEPVLPVTEQPAPRVPPRATTPPRRSPSRRSPTIRRR
ncbi:PQQ-binding-like beta-propeller repeat protein [Skermanella pratensis]|uniref:PQQ-binding-like beta-propeller repeat protein n=1 Tax=Skermanella pratensis TaxID=2233999 RepID=UPI0031B5FA12